MRDKKRENTTVEVMASIYCKGNHADAARDAGGLCPQCRQVCDYAAGRTAACPMGEKKTTCGSCPVHCYRPDMRESIRAIMRYAGPRMILHHPVLAVRHLLKKD